MYKTLNFNPWKVVNIYWKIGGKRFWMIINQWELSLKFNLSHQCYFLFGGTPNKKTETLHHVTRDKFSTSYYRISEQDRMHEVERVEVWESRAAMWLLLQNAGVGLETQWNSQRLAASVGHAHCRRWTTARASVRHSSHVARPTTHDPRSPQNEHETRCETWGVRHGAVSFWDVWLDR